MKWKILYFAFALSIACQGVPETAHAGDAMGKRKILIDFSAADSNEWYAINDGVMGGVSRSDIRPTDQGTGVFTGVLSLENNGGFASVRVVVGPLDLSMYSGLEIRTRGDGRTYQLRLRTNDKYDGIAYAAEFKTSEGEWTTTRFPFDQFRPTYRGRALIDVPSLDASRIHQLAFLLADKKPGPFSLEIDFVRTGESNTINP